MHTWYVLTNFWNIIPPVYGCSGHEAEVHSISVALEPNPTEEGSDGLAPPCLGQEEKAREIFISNGQTSDKAHQHRGHSVDQGDLSTTYNTTLCIWNSIGEEFGCSFMWGITMYMYSSSALIMWTNPLIVWFIFSQPGGHSNTSTERGNCITSTGQGKQEPII